MEYKITFHNPNTPLQTLALLLRAIDPMKFEQIPKWDISQGERITL